MPAFLMCRGRGDRRLIAASAAATLAVCFVLWSSARDDRIGFLSADSSPGRAGNGEPVIFLTPDGSSSENADRSAFASVPSSVRAFLDAHDQFDVRVDELQSDIAGSYSTLGDARAPQTLVWKDIGHGLTLSRGSPFDRLGAVFLHLPSGTAGPHELVFNDGNGEYFVLEAGRVREAAVPAGAELPAGVCVSADDGFSAEDPRLVPAVTSLGAVSATATWPFEIVLLNQLDDAVRLGEPSTSCGCVEVESYPTSVDPGCTGLIRLAIMPSLAKSRRIKQFVRVPWQAGAVQGTAVAQVSGTIAASAVIEPEAYTVDLRRRAAVETAVFLLRVDGESVRDVAPVELPRGVEFLRANPRPGGSVSVELRVVPAELVAGSDRLIPAGRSSFAAVISYRASREGGSDLSRELASLRLSVHAAPWFDLKPPAQFLGEVRAGSAVELHFTTRRAIQTVTSDGHPVVVRGDGAGTYTVGVVCPVKPGPFHQTLIVSDGRRTSTMPLAGIVRSKIGD